VKLGLQVAQASASLHVQPNAATGEDVDAADGLAEQQEGAAMALAAAAQVAAVVLDVDAAGAPEALQRAAGQLHDDGLLVGSRVPACNPTLILLPFHAEAAQGTFPYHDAIPFILAEQAEGSLPTLWSKARPALPNPCSGVQQWLLLD